jgi:cytochrome b6-f complex iron-sulfur subunit
MNVEAQAPLAVAPEPTGVSRRWVLRAAWGSLGATGLLGLYATGRFMLPTVLYEPPTRFVLGRPEDFRPDEVDARFQRAYNVFVVRSGSGLYVLSGQCTHLGCTINWFGAQQRFKCPCHGSNFDHEGHVVGGPAPASLMRVAIEVGPEGRLVADTAQRSNGAESGRPGLYLVEAGALR